MERLAPIDELHLKLAAAQQARQIGRTDGVWGITNDRSTTRRMWLADMAIAAGSFKEGFFSW